MLATEAIIQTLSIVRIDTTIILAVIRNLRPPPPNDLSTSRDDPQLANVDFDDGALCQHTKLRVHGILRVLLHGDDGQLHGDAKLGMRDVGLFVAEAHGPDEALVFYRPSSKVGAHCRSHLELDINHMG